MESNTNFVQQRIDEDGWVIQITEGLDLLEKQEEEEELCASIFNVPKQLVQTKPHAYIPHSVSIGPYHRWRSELYEMERYKLAAVHRFEKRMDRRGKFQSVVVEEFRKQDWHTRSCYHNFIDYKGETLAWIMAIDAAFLLECLQFYVRHSNETSDTDVKKLGQVLHPTGASAAHNSILRDVMMLENQLPLFLIQKLLELQIGSKAKAKERLSRLLRLLCQELSPFSFKLPDDSNLHINERGHLLEVLYHAIAPAVSHIQNPDPSDEEESESPDSVDMSIVTKAFSTLLWKSLSSINFQPFRFLTEFHERALKVISLSRVVRKDNMKSEEEEGNSDREGKVNETFVKIISPRRDELAIPSVVDLHSAGIKFVPTNGDLTTIQFDQNTATLHLPRLTLDTNTEVTLTNLVAFEASAAPGALIFARYTDFMNGIIDCEDDVKLLRESGIISNYLQSDREVASLWNSMGRCVHLTKVGFLDQVIEDVNSYYNRKWKVVMVKFVKKHIFASWQFLTVVASVLVLAISCLQTFCSMYECKN